MRFGVAGRKLDRRASLVDRAVQVLLGRERAGEIDVGVNEVRFQFDCLPELRDRRVKFAGGH